MTIRQPYFVRYVVPKVFYFDHAQRFLRLPKDILRLVEYLPAVSVRYERGQLICWLRPSPDEQESFFMEERGWVFSEGQLKRLLYTSTLHDS